ncbi:MAG: hypothetical protein KDD58_13355 [Bdellovibrionales bacterium]|nr:hypothetical protein [Bdellovibrionales bacterium]
MARRLIINNKMKRVFKKSLIYLTLPLWIACTKKDIHNHPTIKVIESGQSDDVNDVIARGEGPSTSSGKSSGGGGFEILNSKKLFDIATYRLRSAIQATPESIFEKLPKPFNKRTSVVNLFINIELNLDKNVERYGKNLMFNYYYDKSGKVPYIEVLEPFGRNYAHVSYLHHDPQDYLRQVKDVEFRLLWEFAHILLNHGDRIDSKAITVDQAETEAENFAKAFSETLRSHYQLCREVKDPTGKRGIPEINRFYIFNPSYGEGVNVLSDGDSNMREDGYSACQEPDYYFETQGENHAEVISAEYFSEVLLDSKVQDIEPCFTRLNIPVRAVYEDQILLYDVHGAPDTVYDRALIRYNAILMATVLFSKERDSEKLNEYLFYNSNSERNYIETRDVFHADLKLIRKPDKDGYTTLNWTEEFRIGNFSYYHINKYRENLIDNHKDRGYPIEHKYKCVEKVPPPFDLNSVK